MSEKYGKEKTTYDVPNKYFDYQATTPMDSRVLDAMMPYMTTEFGNMHSRTHSFSLSAKEAVEYGRFHVAELLNADPMDIVFTSGATESDNLALKGFAEYHKYDLHIITQQTEHAAILDSCRWLEDKGVAVTYLPVQKNGKVCLEKLRDAITPKTKLVSIMAVNNEQGVIQPLKEIGQICKEHDIVFHTDACQAYGKINLDVKENNIGLMSISGHKIYGPKGIGAIYVRGNPVVRLAKQMHGCGQERGIRSGTVPVFLTVGFGKAAEIAKKEMIEDKEKARRCKEKFLEVLKEKLGDGFIQNGVDAIYTCVNISFPHVEIESLLMMLKEYGLSSGSKSSTDALEPSYVLRAMGASDDLAHSSIRFGFGRFTDEEEVSVLANKTADAVISLRKKQL